MIVHFEGLDLAGKSTLCRRFIDQAPGEWQYRRNRVAAENPVQDLADNLRLAREMDDAVLGELYWAALVYDIAAWRPPSENLVQDSTLLLRSYAFHATFGRTELARRIHDQLDRHPRFDRSFVCTCDRDVRLSRLARRRPENLAADDFLVRDDPARFADMEACLIETAVAHFGAEVVDTSHLEESEDVGWLIARIPELDSGPSDGQ